MRPEAFHIDYRLALLIASPFLVFAGYVAWLVVPVVLAEVVPAVVRTVTTSN